MAENTFVAEVTFKERLDSKIRMKLGVLRIFGNPASEYLISKKVP